MEYVNFYNQQNFKSDAERTFISQRDLIQELIPNADIQHVGSTAIPNSLTKGDLDIQVAFQKLNLIRLSRLFPQYMN